MHGWSGGAFGRRKVPLGGVLIAVLTNIPPNSKSQTRTSNFRNR